MSDTDPRIRIAVIGAESSGGRFAAAWLAQDTTLDVAHWSMPHGAGPYRRWPTETGEIARWNPDRVVWTVRNWAAQIRSATERHTLDRDAAEGNAVYAEMTVGSWLFDPRSPAWYRLSYDGLIAEPRLVMGDLLDWLGRPWLSPPEAIIDGNARRAEEVSR